MDVYRILRVVAILYENPLADVLGCLIGFST